MKTASSILSVVRSASGLSKPSCFGFLAAIVVALPSWGAVQQNEPLLPDGRKTHSADSGAQFIPRGNHQANFDKRRTTQFNATGLTEKRRRAAADLRARVPGLRVEWDDLLGTPKLIGSPGGFLTGPNGEGKTISATSSDALPQADPHRAVKAFLNEHAALFEHGTQVLAKARVKREFVTPHNGLRTVVWQQEVEGIPVFEGLLIGHTTRKGELVNLSSQLLPDVEQAVAKGTPAYRGRQTKLAITPAEATVQAATLIGEDLRVDEIQPVEPRPGLERGHLFKAPALRGEAYAQLVWFPMSRDALRLAYSVELTGRSSGQMSQVVLDAETGELLVQRSLTHHASDATYRVFTSDSPSPFSPGHSVPSPNQPPVVERSLVTLSALSATASPNGWINDGENETLGNNVDAHLDRNGDDLPDVSRPQGSPFRTFDFSLDLAQDPATYSSAAVVQLFYWCNWMHDKLYDLGFTEAAGNFQNDNFGRGGVGGDALVAEAQNAGANNAVFSFYLPFTDGLQPRMEMCIFTGPTPDRDSALDAEIVLHEYTHGLSSRLVGGGIGLTALQSGGLGEGWSDFYALALLSEPSDDVDGNYASGAYASYALGGLGYLENYYYGIRRYPYSTQMNKNPLTFKDMDPYQASSHPGVPKSPLTWIWEYHGVAEEHNIGEIWCAMLWDVRANLIRKHGFTTGNPLTLQLVTDGMKLAPPNPNFVQARDAILQADLINNAGANTNEIWTAFAKRGLGANASSPGAGTTVGIREGFDLPDTLSVIPAVGFFSIGPAGGPFLPACASFALSNAGATELTWAAKTSENWLEVVPAAGVLPEGGATNVTVCVSSNVNVLSNALYRATITLSNLSTGGWRSRQCDLRIGGPDLVVTEIAGPTNAATGQTITLTNAVQNVGSEAAGPFSVGLYLSADSTVTTSDRRLGEWVSTALTAGQTSTTNVAVEIPVTVPAGNYYLGAVADYDGHVLELLETNNIRLGNPIGIQIGPDLVAASVSGPAVVSPGGYAAVSAVVENAGTGGASTFYYVAYYLSTNAVLGDADDVQITSGYVPSGPGAGGRLTNTTTLRMPVTAVPGTTYYWGARVDWTSDADYRNRITESDENNNTAVGNAVAMDHFPKVVSLSVTGVVNGPVGGLSATFSEPMDAATFGTSDVTVRRPDGQAVALAGDPIDAGDGRTFMVTFAEWQTVAGAYQVSVGPDVLDLAGNAMDQNGDGLQGDAYAGSFTIANTVAQLPCIETFEAGDLNFLAAWWSFECTTGRVVVSSANPRSANYALQMEAPPINLWDSEARWYQAATLHLDLTGRTNVVLDFWNKRCTGPDNWGYVGVSVGDGSKVLLPGYNGRLSYNYEHFSYNLDALNLPYTNDMQIHFRSYGNWHGGVYAWDDIRVRVADKRLSVGRAADGRFAVDFVPQPGLNYTVQYRSDLSTNAFWQPLPGGPHNSGYLLLSNDLPQRFYRLLITNP